GKEDSRRFLEDIKAHAVKLVDEVVHSSEVFSPRFPDAKQCPFCKGAMMKVVDNIGQNHFLCQRLSCSYEEMEVKKRVMVPGKVAPPKRVVKVKSSSPSEGTKKRVVLKKAPPKKPAMQSFSLPDDQGPQFTWETVIEVVRPSKLVSRGQQRETREDRGGWKPPVQSRHIVEEVPSSGGSFADFLKASEDRKKRDKNKKHH
ncbi:MAG: DNA topoisomerase III, partial [Sphaerochaetaceae bacterium]